MSNPINRKELKAIKPAACCQAGYPCHSDPPACIHDEAS